MGTTLTGTTPATTYDSLIKVTDNGPISATLKTLSDGLGNDSALALSTKALQIKKTDTIQTSAGCISHFTNDYIYYFGGAAGIVISDFASTARLQIYNNSAVAFEAGSAERMRITSTGNVGIGTSAPSAPLSVAGGTHLAWTGPTSRLTIDRSGVVARLQNYDNGSVANLALQWDGGNVGIGTDAPSTKLHIYNGEATIGSGTDGVKLSYSGGNSSGIIDTAFSDNNLEFRTNGNTKMWIANGGNVGIGTSAPQDKLAINGNAQIVGQSTNTGYDRYFKLYGNTDPATNPNRWAGLAVYNNGGNNVNELAFFAGAGDSARTEKMRIDSSGNVGIGTSVPTNLLHLTGASATPSLRLGSVSAGFYWDIGRENATTGDFVFNNASGGASTERVRILSAGGITFNGDTAAANALDDYEEGTFTLTFEGNSVAGTYTPTAVNATYTKIGRVVTLQYKATFAGGASGGSGNMVIGGLPFNYPSDSGGMTSSIILSDASWSGSYLGILPTTSGSASTLIIVETAPSTALVNFVQAGDFNTSTDIRFTLTYQV